MEAVRGWVWIFSGIAQCRPFCSQPIDSELHSKGGKKYPLEHLNIDKVGCGKVKVEKFCFM